MKRCTVIYALPDRQWQWRVELPELGTVADALALARAQATEQSIPWDAPDLGIFGEACDLATRPRAGDRIEIYRPLRSDPKVSRRARAAAGKAAADQASSRPRTSVPQKTR